MSYSKADWMKFSSLKQLGLHVCHFWWSPFPNWRGRLYPWQNWSKLLYLNYTRQSEFKLRTKIAAIGLLILKKKFRTKIAADISSTSENHIITELLKVIPFYNPMNKIIVHCQKRLPDYTFSVTMHLQN